MAYPVNAIFKQQWNSAHVPRRKSNVLKTEPPNLVHLAVQSSNVKVAGRESNGLSWVMLSAVYLCSYFVLSDVKAMCFVSHESKFLSVLSAHIPLETQQYSECYGCYWKK